jgi:hypothetical protein
MNRFMPTAFLVSMVMFFGYQNHAESASSGTPEKNVTTDAQEQSGAVTSGTEKERREFVAKAEKDLSDLKTKMRDLEEKAATATGDAKDKLTQQMKTLKQEMKVAGQKLGKLKSAANSTWKNFASDVSNSINRIKASFKNGKD